VRFMRRLVPTRLLGTTGYSDWTETYLVILRTVFTGPRNIVFWVSSRSVERYNVRVISCTLEYFTGERKIVCRGDEVACEQKQKHQLDCLSLGTTLEASYT
jgi:hypothetical protein